MPLPAPVNRSTRAISVGFLVLSMAGCNQAADAGRDAAVDSVSASDAGDAALPAGDAAAADDGGLPVVEFCTTNSACADALGSGGDRVPAVCRRSDGRCVALGSVDCTTVTGDYTDDAAILVGSLFSLTGSQAATNLVRQRSATLAVEEINRWGGIPGPDSAPAGRQLVMVSCDEAADPTRAAKHLVEDLGAVAIVGPNLSQDVIDLTQKLTASAGTLMITPTAVASSITDLDDRDLTWSVVPSDLQRAPLMLAQVRALESEIKQARTDPDAGVPEPVKLGVVYRRDALGVGTNVSLNELVINGAKITDGANLAYVKRTAYDGAAADQAALVAEYLAFKPDIIVMAGLAEAITKVMVKLEQGWGAGPRPQYVLIDSLKVPDLLKAAQDDVSLRARVRGTGITPGKESQPFYDAFKADYNARYNDTLSELTSGMGPAYDATYAIAFALTATRADAPSGAAVARGLRTLGARGSERIGVQNTNTLRARRLLAAGTSITPIGTFAPLLWDEFGALRGGTLEVWCIGLTGSAIGYRSSGLTFDLATNQSAGAYKACAQ